MKRDDGCCYQAVRPVTRLLLWFYESHNFVAPSLLDSTPRSPHCSPLIYFICGDPRDQTSRRTLTSDFNNELVMKSSSVLNIHRRYPHFLLPRPRVHHIALLGNPLHHSLKQLVDLFEGLLFGLWKVKVDDRERHTKIWNES